ncbi:hypothetical protein, partial [Myroides odoratimimus]
DKLVKENETVTKLVDNKDGTYTYYNEKEFDETGKPLLSKGVTFTLPTYDSYIMTGIEGYSIEKRTVRTFNYSDIVHTLAGQSLYKPNPSLNFKQPPLYQLNFKVNRNPAETKFIQFSTIIDTRINLINNIVPQKSSYSVYFLKIYINDVEVHSLKYVLDYPQGGLNSKSITATKAISLKNVVLKENNTISVVLVPEANLFAANKGTDSGQFLEGNNKLLTLSVEDISFQLFEK